MTCEKFQELAAMPIQLNIKPIATPYGDFWVIEMAYDEWNELQESIGKYLHSFSRPDENDTLAMLKEWSMPTIREPWSYAYWDKPFANCEGLIGSMAIRPLITNCMAKNTIKIADTKRAAMQPV